MPVTMSKACGASYNDYVLGTGEMHSVREFVELSFKEVGVGIEWRGEGVEEKGFDAATGECLVRVDPQYFRPTEVEQLLADPTKAREKLGWTHTRFGAGSRQAGVIQMQAKYSLEGKRVFIAGHRGMVGSAIMARLQSENCAEILTAGRDGLDLTRQESVDRWMQTNKPDAVFIAAAKVGGILANDTYPAEFLYENLMIEANLIHAAHVTGVEKLLFLGSSCIYPKFAPQPIAETALLEGALEPTNEWYAIAKIAGIKLCQSYYRQYNDNFISAMPTNLYGPGDNYDLQTSHVIPALIRKAVEAKHEGRQSIDAKL